MLPDKPTEREGVQERQARSALPKSPTLTAAAKARPDTEQIPPLPMLRQLDRCLRETKARHCAVVIEPRGLSLAPLLAESWPDLEVTVLTSEQSLEELHTQLTAVGPLDVLVDLAGPGAEQVTRWRRCFWHVRSGGRYLVADTLTAGTETDRGQGLWCYVAVLLDVPRSEEKPAGRQAQDDLQLATALRSVHLEGPTLILGKRTDALPKTRERQIGTILEARPKLGTVITTLPAAPLTSAATLEVNLHDYDKRFRPVFDNPPMALRAYRSVSCYPHQVAVADGVLLPDTYRHYYGPRLQNRFLQEVAQDFARLKGAAARAEVQPLTGAYFYLDSEWPDHFGHTMTEQLSRLWALPAAQEAYPDLQGLILLRREQQTISAFQQEIFAAAGLDQVVAVRGPVQAETLLAATPMLSNPDFMDARIAATWARVRDSLLAQAEDRDRPDRIFCSRRPRYKRACHNIAEVEALARAHGYAVVFPEDYDLPEQVAMFNGAQRIAGLAGSAMFTSALCRGPRDLLIVSSESYTARNEYMIASVLGHRLEVIWCDADEKQPAVGWSGTAFSSGFTVDLVRDGDRLRRWLDG